MKNEQVENLGLNALVERLQAQQLKKRDLVIPASCLRMENGNVVITNSNPQVTNAFNDLLSDTGITQIQTAANEIVLTPNEIGYSQIAEKLKIPLGYFDRMRTGNVVLLDQNVNGWLAKDTRSFFVRTFVDAEERTGILRSFLSSTYRVIDNLDVLIAALNAVKESGVDLQIQTCSLTDSRMYVRMIAPTIYHEAEALVRNYVTPGNEDRTTDFRVFSGIVISNSETGMGTYQVSPYGIVSACKNGMIWRGDAMRRTHLGAKMDDFTVVSWSKETKLRNMELILSQTRDAVKTFVSPEYLGAKIREIENKKIALTHPVAAVNNVCADLGYSEEKKGAILDYFLRSGDLSSFGITQAMTYYAHANAGADERFEMEYQAVEILDRIPTIDRKSTK